MANTVQTTPFPGNVNTATLDDAARFYASQGVTVLMAEDAAMYAYDWLATVGSVDQLATIAIRSARNCTEAAIRAGVFPAGLNDDYTSSGGLLSQASFSVPGMVFLPTPVVPSSGGLPYGNPPNAVAGPSNSVGTDVPDVVMDASGSSSNAGPAQQQALVSGIDTAQSPSNDDDKVDFDAMTDD